MLGCLESSYILSEASRPSKGFAPEQTRRVVRLLACPPLFHPSSGPSNPPLNDLFPLSLALLSFQLSPPRTGLTYLSVLFVLAYFAAPKENETLGYLLSPTALCFSLTRSPMILIRNLMANSIPLTTIPFAFAFVMCTTLFLHTG